jgi:hypothetical protein
MNHRLDPSASSLIYFRNHYTHLPSVYIPTAPTMSTVDECTGMVISLRNSSTITFLLPYHRLQPPWTHLPPLFFFIPVIALQFHPTTVFIVLSLKWLITLHLLGTSNASHDSNPFVCSIISGFSSCRELHYYIQISGLHQS